MMIYKFNKILRLDYVDCKRGVEPWSTKAAYSVNPNLAIGNLKLIKAVWWGKPQVSC